MIRIESQMTTVGPGRRGGWNVMNRRWIRCASIALVCVVCGCGLGGDGPGKVVVYSALDREFAAPLLEAYSKSTSVATPVKFDVESTKTVGLVNLIIAEAAAPRCDLFWNNEILNTIRLSEKGLLAKFEPTNAGMIPDVFKGSQGDWYGFAARARVLLVNTQILGESERPQGIGDLLKPGLAGRVGIAKPLFGTTATHAACLFAAWGDERAQAYFRALKANGVHVFSGNKQVAIAVGSGEIAVGLTDTDDAMGEVEAGRPVAIIYPDREPSQLGTLFIPNTIAIVKGTRRLDAAKRLASHLLSPEIEAQLAAGPSAQIPLLKTSSAVTRVETPMTVHAMEIDFAAAASAWGRAAQFLAAEFAE